jgi:hypothetical protein
MRQVFRAVVCRGAAMASIFAAAWPLFGSPVLAQMNAQRGVQTPVVGYAVIGFNSNCTYTVDSGYWTVTTPPAHGTLDFA